VCLLPLTLPLLLVPTSVVGKFSSPGLLPLFSTASSERLILRVSVSINTLSVKLWELRRVTLSCVLIGTPGLPRSTSRSSPRKELRSLDFQLVTGLSSLTDLMLAVPRVPMIKSNGSWTPLRNIISKFCLMFTPSKTLKMALITLDGLVRLSGGLKIDSITGETRPLIGLEPGIKTPIPTTVSTMTTLLGL